MSAKKTERSKQWEMLQDISGNETVTTISFSATPIRMGKEKPRPNLQDCSLGAIKREKGQNESIFEKEYLPIFFRMDRYSFL